MGRFLFSAGLSLISLNVFAEDQEVCVAQAKTAFAAEIVNLEPNEVRDKAIEFEKKLKDCGIEVVSVHQKKKDRTATTQPIEITEEEEQQFYAPPGLSAPLANTRPHDLRAIHKDLRACIDDAVQQRKDTRVTHATTPDRDERRDARHARHDTFKTSVEECIAQFKDAKQDWKDARNADRDHPITTQPIKLKDPPQGAFKIQPVNYDPGVYRTQPIEPVSFVDDGN